MNLKELLHGLCDYSSIESFHDLEIESISCDSRSIEGKSLFVATKGSQFNGKDFIHEAVNKGAKIVVAEECVQPLSNDILVLEVSNVHQFLRDVSKRFYGDPSSQVKVIGITGTNGKTTVAYLVESILQSSGHNCGVIGSINYRMGDDTLPSKNTTPGFLDNQKFLVELKTRGVEYCVMEVSSHALHQGRVDLIDFETAIFTNLTSDHLDYHKTQEEYFNAKMQLFSSLSKKSTAVINLDDEFGKKVLELKNSKVITYGINTSADVMAKDIHYDTNGTKFNLLSPLGEVKMKTELIGAFNVYNILAAVSFGISQRISLEDIKKGIRRLSFVPGRLERVDCGEDFSIFIDYAHTEDALKNVLQTVRAICQQKIILVFGCGGDRDQSKRSKMGQVASELADFSFVTNDNPRGEKPEVIIEQIVKGFDKDNKKIVMKRDEAICEALKMAQVGDIVLITGKGHETYQIFKDQTFHFDEREIVRKFFDT